MHGNDYAGPPGAFDGAPERELSSDEIRTLRAALSGIAARTRSYLPEGYAVGAEVSRGVGGVRATVAVRPPVGDPVTAGLAPEADDLREGLSDEDRDEVARGLAASAATQAMQAAGERPRPAR